VRNIFPIDATKPFLEYEELKLLREENARLTEANEHLMNCLVEVTNALVRIARKTP
jgi:hypothetical protein